MSKAKVPEELVTKLAAAGVDDVSTFANLVDDVESLRKIAKEDLGVSPDSLGDRVNIAALVCAWKSAQARTSEMDKNDAQAQVQDKPKPLLTGDHESMHTLFEKRFWKLEADRVPGKSLIEKS